MALQQVLCRGGQAEGLALKQVGDTAVTAHSARGRGTGCPDPPAGRRRGVGSLRHKLDIWSARSKDFLKLNTNQPVVFYGLAFCYHSRLTSLLL